MKCQNSRFHEVRPPFHLFRLFCLFRCLAGLRPHQRLARPTARCSRELVACRASGPAVFMLMYVSQARSCAHQEPDLPLNWPDTLPSPRENGAFSFRGTIG